MTVTSSPIKADERDAVRRETQRTLDFWSTFGRDGEGGWNVRLNGDGTPYETSSRNVVASARFVANFSLGAIAFDSAQYRLDATDAFAYLQSTFADHEHGGYFWTVSDGRPADTRKLAYGHAFAVLASATATKAGLPGALDQLRRDTALAEDRYFRGGEVSWDTADADWSNIGTAVHSNNPNMHFCEAFIAAYEATEDPTYLERAMRIARLLGKPASALGRPILENYDADWSPTADIPEGIDRSAMQSSFPALPGHLAEWAKLLAILHVHSGEDWLLPAALLQYRLAWSTGWDETDGGFALAIDGQGHVVEGSKPYWAPPEAVGAAANLQRITGDVGYEADRGTLWSFMTDTMSDPALGGWYKTPSTFGARTDFRKGDEYDPDYHALGGCWEVLGVARAEITESD